MSNAYLDIYNTLIIISILFSEHHVSPEYTTTTYTRNPKTYPHYSKKGRKNERKDIHYPCIDV